LHFIQAEASRARGSHAESVVKGTIRLEWVEVWYGLVFGACICSGNFLHFIQAEASRARGSHAESVVKGTIRLESPFFWYCL
jgi:hypothetical protein